MGQSLDVRPQPPPPTQKNPFFLTDFSTRNTFTSPYLHVQSSAFQVQQGRKPQAAGGWRSPRESGAMATEVARPSVCGQAVEPPVLGTPRCDGFQALGLCFHPAPQPL